VSEQADELVVETDLDADPAKVWRALTEPELLGAWLLPTPGEIDCTLLEAEPGRRLRYGWREAGGGIDSEVSFVLTPGPQGGTHLRIVHAPVVVSLAEARARARPATSPPIPPLKMAA